MADEPISKETVQFIVGNFSSIGQLEVFLLLFGTRGREWTTDGVRQELRSSDHSATQFLVDMKNRGFFVALEYPGRATTYRFKSEDANLSRSARAVEEVYRVYRSRVIDLIYQGRGNERIRSFADAFKFRKEGKD